MGKIGGIEYDADQVKTVATVVGLLLGGLLVWRIAANWFDAQPNYQTENAAQMATYWKEQTAREAKRKQDLVDAAKAAADLAAVEAARSPEERARLAVEALSTVVRNDPAIGICRAHRLMDPIATKDRASPDVRAAFALLASKEAEQLRADRPAFLAGRMSICGDGATSDCPCNGAHRGCCSSHGGLAGCQPIPTAVYCPE